MTGKPTFATFKADVLDDSYFSDEGDMVTPRGRELAKVLTRALHGRGFKISEWSQRDFYGWQTTVELSGQKAWILLQGGEPWLLIVEKRNGIFGCVRTTGDAFRKLLLEIDASLKSEECFRAISWFTRSEYEEGGQAGRPKP